MKSRTSVDKSTQENVVRCDKELYTVWDSTKLFAKLCIPAQNNAKSRAKKYIELCEEVQLIIERNANWNKSLCAL